MKKLNVLAAGLLILPLAAWAGVGHEAAQSVVGVSPAQSSQGTAAMRPAAHGVGYNCCWIWMSGQWWCVPC